MAAARPGKPFTRGGITYPSQYAYRKAIAARAGFTSPAQRAKARQQSKTIIESYTSTLTPEQRGVLAAQIADWAGALGPYREGTPAAERTSGALPPELYLMLRRLGADAYPLWRLLYR